MFYVDEFNNLQKIMIILLGMLLYQILNQKMIGMVRRVLFIMFLYENYLKEHEAPEDCEYYMCGPPMMNKACIDSVKPWC